MLVVFIGVSLLLLIASVISEHAWQCHSTLCICSQSTLSQLEEFNLKNIKDFMININLSDCRRSKTTLGKLGKVVQHV